MKTFYEFFAGGGMARAGLGATWRCLFANDLSKKKGESYIANWGDDDLHVGDINDVDCDAIPAHADLAWASFPCQDLSLAGNGAGLDGKRSSAFWGYWQLIRVLKQQGRKPRMIVLENVLGALTSHEGKDFAAIAAAIFAEDYIFGAMVIDAVHFVPQSRPRLFIVGISKELTIPLNLLTEEPTKLWHSEAVVRAHQRLSSLQQANWRWWNPKQPTKNIVAFESLLEQIPNGSGWHSKAETDKLLDSMTDLNRRKVSQAQQSGKLTVGTIYRRTRNGIVRAEVRFDGISGCLRTPTGGSSRQTILLVEGERVRSRLLSAREAARLMGLPENYKLPASYNEAYHLAGDGVVVPVVTHLAESLLDPIIAAQSSKTFRAVA